MTAVSQCVVQEGTVWEAMFSYEVPDKKWRMNGRVFVVCGEMETAIAIVKQKFENAAVHQCIRRGETAIIAVERADDQEVTR